MGRDQCESTARNIVSIVLPQPTSTRSADPSICIPVAGTTITLVIAQADPILGFGTVGLKNEDAPSIPVTAVPNLAVCRIYWHGLD